jgi:hypothetical protein
VTFPELCEQYGITYLTGGHEHCNLGWIQTDCPYCGMEGHYRLGFNLSGGYFSCWACGRQKLWETLSLLTGEPLKAVGAFAKGLTEGVILEDLPKTTAGRVSFPIGLVNLTTNHQSYLRRDRKFEDVESLKRLWGIRSVNHLGGLYRHRIWIPVLVRGEVVSWTTRSVSSLAQKRYRSASVTQEKYHHKNLLYGEDYCWNCVVVCEGPIDVWKVGPGAVATFGTAVRPTQVDRISKFPVRVILFDGEKAAQWKANSLVRELQGFPGETYNVVLESGKDPGEADEKELEELRKRFLK